MKPALIPELGTQWPPCGHDGQPWAYFGAQYMRDLPYGGLPAAPESESPLTSAVHVSAACESDELHYIKA